MLSLYHTFPGDSMCTHLFLCSLIHSLQFVHNSLPVFAGTMTLSRHFRKKRRRPNPFGLRPRGKRFSLVLADEHDKKADRQQRAGHPDPALGEILRQQRATARAQSKEADHAEIRQRLVQHLAVVRVKIGAQRVRAAAHIADAHGAGIRVSAHLAEGLHLHGADEGNERVGRCVEALRQKADEKQQHDLHQNDELAPVDLFHALIAPVHTLCHENARHKRQHRHKIARAERPFPFKQVGAEEHDIARLRVGEDLSAAEVGVGVLQAAGKDDEHSRQHRFRHLAVCFFCKGTHVMLSSLSVFCRYRSICPSAAAASFKSGPHSSRKRSTCCLQRPM